MKIAKETIRRVAIHTIVGGIRIDGPRALWSPQCNLH